MAKPTRNNPNNRLERIHRTVLYLLIAVLACFFIYMIVWESTQGVEAEAEEQERMENIEFVSTPPPAYEETEMSQRVDSMVRRAHRLDTTIFSISLYDATARRFVYGHNEDQALTPASVQKIPTAIAALELLGPDHEFTTELQVCGTMRGDTLLGELLLRADDDPNIESLDTMAAQLRRSGIRAIRGTVRLDLFREDALRPHPTARVSELPRNRMKLMMHGKQHIREHLMAVLAQREIGFRKDTTVAPQGDYRTVATIKHTLTEVVTPMLIHSSNVKAETLLFHLDKTRGFIKGGDMNWDLRHVVSRFWVRHFARRAIDNGEQKSVLDGMALTDGSGLSRENLISSRAIVEMLRYAYEKESLRRYLIDEALAEPGDSIRRGSMLNRVPHLRKRLFVKTGTMPSRGVSSLAGYMKGSDDHWYIFCIINNNAPVDEGRLFQDQFCELVCGKKQ